MNLKQKLQPYGLYDEPNTIRLYWWQENGISKNFGDVLNPWLVEKMTGKKCIYSNKRCIKPYHLVIGSVAFFANRNAIVWGTGVLTEKMKMPKPKKVHAVRGPLTRQRYLDLGVECPEVYGDPALLLPLYYKKKVKKTHKMGLVVHHFNMEEVKEKCKDKNILLIDLFDPIETVIDNILSCETIASSSLHGIVVAQAYDIPALWIEFDDKNRWKKKQQFKFKDYFLSVGLEPYEPYYFVDSLPTIKEVQNLVKQHPQKIKFDAQKLLDACPFLEK